jgi:hypothetical protein
MMNNNMITGSIALIAGVAIGWFATPTEEIPISSDTSDFSQVISKLVKAGEIIDPELKIAAVKDAFKDTTANEIDILADSVMKLAKRRPDMTIREEFLSHWGGLSPQKALAYLGSVSQLNDRTTILTAWGRSDPDAAAENFQPSNKELSGDSLAEASAILDGIAKADPVKAILFADRFALANLTRLEFTTTIFPSNPSFEPSGSYQIAIDNWIRHNPERAFEVILSLKFNKVREQALNELFFFDWPYYEPKASQAAVNLLWDRALIKGDSRVPFLSLDLIRNLAQHLGALNDAETYERALGLADPEQRLAAFNAAMDGWKSAKEGNLSVVADFVAMRLNSKVKLSTESELLVDAAGWTAGWLTEDGENNQGIGKAAAWLEKLPAGEARDEAVRGIVSAWAWLPEQQKKLAAWAHALPPSHQRDIAVANCAKTMFEENPVRAMDMAATIQDPALRAGALAQVGAPYISKEEGGEMIFDIQKWLSENQKIGAELQTARKPK